jgi:hypothetical protein
MSEALPSEVAGSRERATLMRRSDGYNERCCACKKRSGAPHEIGAGLVLSASIKGSDKKTAGLGRRLRICPASAAGRLPALVAGFAIVVSAFPPVRLFVARGSEHDFADTIAIG